MRLYTPDPEELLPGLIRGALTPDWPGLKADRAKPDGGKHIVTVSRSGGLLRGPALDHARLSINVYAPTEDEASRLAEDVRALLNGHQHRPFTRISIDGPTAVNSKGEQPQRFMSGDALIQRRTRT